MKSGKRARLDGDDTVINRWGYVNSSCRVSVRNCGDDQLHFELMGLFFLEDGSVIVRGGANIPDDVARVCTRVVKAPPLFFKLPKNPHMSLEQMKDQIRKEACQTLYASPNPALAEQRRSVLSVDSWLLDTGASHHFCADRAMFSTYEALTHKIRVPMANATSSEIVGVGSIVLKMMAGSTLTLENVRHVPDLRTNVVSGSQLTRSSLKLEFETNKFVLTRNGHFIGNGYLAGGFFKLNGKVVFHSEIYNNV